MKYTRITQTERQQIYRWRQEAMSKAQIAKLLGRHPSTIGRELKRNAKADNYRPGQAQRWARQRARRQGSRKLTESMKEEIERELTGRQWSPEIISQRARKEGRQFVCRESIYRHIYQDARQGGKLWEQLPRAARKRRRRCPRKPGRGRGKTPFRRDIDERPKEVDKRERLGDWEGDLINGAPGSGHLVTLIERRTRYVRVGYVASKDAGPVQREISRLLGRHKKTLKTLTLDNGKEFAQHRRMERSTGVKVYFAKPYHAWERASNENANGLIRRKYPKGSSFEGMDKKRLAEIEQWLNSRPRRCLGWNSPEEEMAAQLGQGEC
jgi:IS30 family transposase